MVRHHAHRPTAEKTAQVEHRFVKVERDEGVRPGTTAEALARLNLKPAFAGKTRLWYGRWDYKFLMAGRGGLNLTHSEPLA